MDLNDNCLFFLFIIFVLNDFSRKLAMLAGVPLALARNMPGAGFADSLILSDLTPPPPVIAIPFGGPGSNTVKF